MSQLILTWLNDDVRLSRKVTEFERDFANGYLLGELLSKHGLVQNFEEDFVNESTLAAKRQNWATVQDAISGAPQLDVRLTDGQVREMMDEDRGSSLKLLFQLRRTLCSKAKGSVVMAAKGGQSQPRLQKQVLDEPEEQFFDQRLKPLRPIDHRYPYEVHNKHFVDEHTQQLRYARECEAEEVAERRQNVQDFRLTQHEKMRKSKAAKELAKKVGEQHWQGVQENKYKMMEKDLNFEKEMINRSHLRIAAVRTHYEQDCGFREGSEDGIAWFEKNLQRIGIDTSEHSGTDIATIEAATLKELYEKMNDKLPTKAQLQIESDKRMAKIRETKMETDIARKERARRQRRVQVEQQATAAAVEAKKREEELQAQQLLETQRLQKEQAEADEKKRRKEAQWEERVAKHTAYKEKFEVEAEEAWQKMVEKAREERAIKMKHQSTTEKERPEEVSDEEKPVVVAAPVERKRGSIAAHMASKEKTKDDLSVNEDEPSSAAPNIEIVPAEELTNCVREQVMMDYLFCKGDWTHYMPTEEETVLSLRRASNHLGENAEAPMIHRLGSVVQWLCKSSPSCTHQAPPEVRKQAQLAKDFLPVVAIAGSPLGLCAGQSPFAAPLAERLAQEFGFYILKPNEVVSECMTLAEKPPQEPDWPILARMRDLGKEALSFRPHGVPPNMLAEMIFRKIELLSAPAPKPVEEEDPKAKKKKDKKEEVPEPVRPNGVLILNYPLELRQCASWQACMEGSWPNLLTTQDSEENHQARLSTLLAPFWTEEIAAPVLKAQEVELAKGAEKVDFDPAFAPSVRVVRLQFPDEASRHAALMKEAAAGVVVNEEVLQAGTFCQGLEQELLSSSAVDQGWLFESSEVLARSFAEPLQNSHDILVQDGEENEQIIPASEACLKTVKELVTFWRRPRDLPTEDMAADEAVEDAPVEDAPEAPEAEAVEAPEAPEVEAAEVEAAVVEVPQDADPEVDEFGEGGEAEELGRPDQVGDTIVIREGYETRQDFHTLWLQGLSSYLLGIRETLQEVDDLAGGYGKDLVFIQRRFLEFLQRPDDKALVLEEFLRNFPMRRNVAPGSRQADEIQEQLQDLADKLWVHANLRKQESVEERQRLLKDGFWEEKANAHLQLSYRLQAYELCRFKVAMAVLKWSYTGEKQGADCFDVSALEEPPPELSSLQELAAWLEDSAERAAGAEPTGLEEADEVEETEVPEVPVTIPEEDSSMLEASVSVENTAGKGEGFELVAAIQAERRALAQKCRCIAAWTFARLEQMRQQYNEIFARMDDWIKDRVREENEAIKETERQLRVGKWEDEEGHQTITRTMTVRRSHTGHIKPAPSSAAGKRRRDVLKVIVPKTLDVDVYVPPKLEVLPTSDATTTGSITRPSSSMSQGRSKSTIRSVPEKWSQEMMWGLLTRLCDDANAGACDMEQLQKALLERRHAALGFQNEQVIPPSWVQRPLAVYHLLCRSFVEPAWGASKVDLTEFFLALAHHENVVAWPNMEALEATRSFLHSEESSLDEEELAKYPDVNISEELFCQLPLWPGGCPAELRKWMFQVLHCFSKEGEVCLPPKPGGQDGKNETSHSITARRILGYFGLATSPAKAFSQFCRLYLPSNLFAAEEDPPPQVLVKDLWTILYSQKTRPAAMMAPELPDLATFCTNLLEEGKVPEAVPKAKAKAKGKAKPEVEEETEVPPVPEEATVAFSEQLLLSRQTVLKALVSHGGLLCRRRGLEMLFPKTGSIFPLKTSAEAAALTELQSLVPEPPAEEEAPEEGGS